MNDERGACIHTICSVSFCADAPNIQATITSFLAIELIDTKESVRESTPIPMRILLRYEECLDDLGRVVINGTVNDNLVTLLIWFRS